MLFRSGRESNSPAHQTLLAKALLAMNRARDALEALDAALRIDAEHAPALRARSSAREQPDDLDGAAADLVAYLALAPADHDADTVLGGPYGRSAAT